MKTIKKNIFFILLITTTSLISCFNEEEIIQPISFTELELTAGGINDGERQTFVFPGAPENVLELSSFGLAITVDSWMEVGEDVEGANTFVSENTIVSFSITSDSTVMVTEDSLFIPGDDLSTLFKTDRVGRSFFEPSRTLDDIVGRKIRLDPLIMQMVSGLEKDLHQTFLVNLTMDDGQTFMLQSNIVRVAAD